ncbi:myosin heavy chain, embryonic smooth muscle isoform [Amborella trichopoda]|uniref:myosin heavy chain, embryonic smooth muscle isoform n=1 Tax=Amborella trichopoda TaxID=13333 RepID=UPI0009BED473|nr:myosin heavy chain, embryonic smooth muscle isoform [Amborella trichopoda]|eukprot:XP_020530405.1 myosin heavy chain, embryonic smooth muscle isoform [Amborella trichopoda]
MKGQGEPETPKASSASRLASPQHWHTDGASSDKLTIDHNIDTLIRCFRKSHISYFQLRRIMIDMESSNKSHEVIKRAKSMLATEWDYELAALIEADAKSDEVIARLEVQLSKHDALQTEVVEGAAQSVRKWVEEKEAALNAAQKHVATLCNFLKEAQCEIDKARSEASRAQEEELRAQAKVDDLSHYLRETQEEASRATAEVKEAHCQREAAQKEALRAKTKVKEMGFQILATQKDSSKAQAKIKEMGFQIEEAQAKEQRALAMVKQVTKVAQVEASRAQAEIQEAHRQIEGARAKASAMQIKVEGAQCETKAAHAEALRAKSEVKKAQSETEAIRAELLRAQSEVKEAHCEMEVAQADALRAQAEVKEALCRIEKMQDEASRAQDEVDRLRRELKNAKSQAMWVSCIDHISLIAEHKGQNSALCHALACSEGRLGTHSKSRILSMSETQQAILSSPTHNSEEEGPSSSVPSSETQVVDHSVAILPESMPHLLYDQGYSQDIRMEAFFPKSIPHVFEHYGDSQGIALEDISSESSSLGKRKRAN